MHTYRVTFRAPYPCFQNAEIDVDPVAEDKIRDRLADSLRQRKPFVYGRDWEYKPVSQQDTRLIEADFYSIVNDSDTAHFYVRESPASNTRRLVTSVLHVTEVREIDTT